MICILTYKELLGAKLHALFVLNLARKGDV